MINANNEPENVGLKPSVGRLIGHCRQHPNLRLTNQGSPYLLLQSNRRILLGEEPMYDYGDGVICLDDSMKARNCSCSKCTTNYATLAVLIEPNEQINFPSEFVSTFKRLTNSFNRSA